MKKIILILTILFTLSFGVANAQTFMQNLERGPGNSEQITFPGNNVLLPN